MIEVKKGLPGTLAARDMACLPSNLPVLQPHAQIIEKTSRHCTQYTARRLYF